MESTNDKNPEEDNKTWLVKGVDNDKNRYMLTLFSHGYWKIDHKFRDHQTKWQLTLLPPSS